MSPLKTDPSISRLLLLSTQHAGDVLEERTSLGIALHAIASGRHLKAEQILLSKIASSSRNEDLTNLLWLLSQLYNQRIYAGPQIGLIHRLNKLVPADDPRIMHLTIQAARFVHGASSRIAVPESQNHKWGEFPHLDFEIIARLVLRGEVSSAAKAIDKTGFPECCEAIILRSQIERFRGDREKAEELLIDYFASFRHRLDYCLQLIELLFELQRGDRCIPALKASLESNSAQGSPLLERYSQARMLQRQPGAALRLKLLERLPTLHQGTANKPTVMGAIYDGLGRTDWLNYLNREIACSTAKYFDLHSNLLMQMSSRSSATYPQVCTAVAETMTHHLAQQIAPFEPKNNATTSLRVGWICADIANHPVARFLLSWLFAGKDNLKHEHLVISIAPGQPRYEQLFRDLPNVMYIDQSAPGTTSERIHRLRKLELDVAVDLNGWTGNHLAAAFVSRIAPLQLNYLAYHASTGIPNMDGWVVDHQLLPSDSSCEWHTEQLVRLPRPFLAWQPHPALPEATAAISPPAVTSQAGIRFGCFNNLRKISNEALQSWSRILRAVPGSSLVLKAFSVEDNATATLLKRRLEKCNLPLDQVIWLPYTATPDEHLQHYALIDVALDSFPNTGCTTTCEALWMGVPVITLQGTHYVSRMASAVLHAALLQEWVCNSLQDYEELAIAQSIPERISWLRSHRHHWRRQIQLSPLGNANDLMQNLESCFSDLAHQGLAKHALQLGTHPPGIIQV